MRTRFFIAALLGCTLIGPARADDKVAYSVHGPYFESNKSGLKGDASYLVFPNKEKFNRALRLTPPLRGGTKADPIKDAAFTEGTVVAVIKRGMAITTYEVRKVTLQKDGVLVVTFTATEGKPGTATFASPLVLSVAKKDVKAVEFVENGKAVKAVKTGR